MIVYLAHPIDQAQALTVLQDAEWYLKHKAVLYFPSRPWSLTTGIDARAAIGAVNEAAQRAASVTLAILPDNVPTLGVPSEIERALQWGQPVGIIAGKAVRQTVQAAEWQREGAIIGDGVASVWRDLRFAQAREAESAIKVRLDPTKPGQLPTRAYDGDAGYDLYCSQGFYLQPGQYLEVPCGFSMEMPPGYWGWLTARSSTARRGLLVNQAVIDQGYRGPMFVGVTNISSEAVGVDQGERLAQLIPMPLCASEIGLVQVEQLSDSERGSNGFGSSGI